jgi:hypothetical protein
MTNQVQTIYEVLALQQGFIQPRQREHDVAAAWQRCGEGRGERGERRGLGFLTTISSDPGLVTCIARRQ